MDPSPSLPDTRQVTVTNDSVVVDGRDITDITAFIYATLENAALENYCRMPLDGIERLRKRLDRP